MIEIEDSDVTEELNKLQVLLDLIDTDFHVGISESQRNWRQCCVGCSPHDIVRVPKVEFDESGFEREDPRRKFARAACVLRGRHIPSKPNIGLPHHVMWLL